MAKKSGNTLIKVVVLLAVAGAVFFALDSWRQKAGVTGVAAPGSAPAMSREEAERIGTEIGTRIGTEIGTQIGLEVAAEMLAERKIQMAAGEPAATQPEPEPVTEPSAPAPAVVAAVEVDVAEEAPAPEPAPAPKPKETRTQGTIPGTPVAQPVDDRDPWWIKSSSGDADTLILTYAGNFKSSDGKLTGIALMFSGRFNSETDFSAISVSGAGIPDQWKLGASPGLIYLPGVPRGNYTVTVKAGLKDVDGKTFKTDISGPVDVQ